MSYTANAHYTQSKFPAFFGTFQIQVDGCKYTPKTRNARLAILSQNINGSSSRRLKERIR